MYPILEHWFLTAQFYVLKYAGAHEAGQNWNRIPVSSPVHFHAVRNRRKRNCDVWYYNTEFIDVASYERAIQGSLVVTDY
jgi:hypothetical protein